MTQNVGIDTGSDLLSRLPFALVLFGVMLIIGLTVGHATYWVMEVRYLESVRTMISHKAVLVSEELETLLDENRKSLFRMAARWERTDNLPDDSWQKDAMTYRRDWTAWHRILWYSSPEEFKEREGVLVIEQPSLQFGEQQISNLRVFNASRHQKNDHEIILLIGAENQSGQVRFLAGYISISSLINFISSKSSVLSQFLVSIEKDGNKWGQVSRSKKDEALAIFSSQSEFEAFGQHFTLQLTPTQSYIDQLRSSNSIVTAILFTTITIFLLYVSYVNFLFSKRHAEATRREEMYLNLNARYKGFLDIAGEAVFAITDDEIITYANRISAELFGVPKESLINRSLADFGFSKEQRKRETVEHILKLIDPNGKEKHVEYTFSSFAELDDGSTQLIVMFDVSNRMAESQRLIEYARHDSLTGLYNRRYFQELVSHTVENRRNTQGLLGLFFLDLDNFKRINDLYGHLAGDEFLCCIADRLRSCSRRADVLARISGDEFAYLVECDCIEHLHSTANKLLSAFNSTIDFRGGRSSISASIGIAVYPNNGRSVEALLKCADTAMYCAKREGKNNFRFFDEALNRWQDEQSYNESMLRNIIDNGNFNMHYQLRFDIARKQICGAEALMRLGTLDEGGEHNTEKYIQIAEDLGLIINLGDQILERTFQDIISFQNRNYFSEQDKISINISGLQLGEPRFIEKISEKLLAVNLAPSNIELEVTERCLVQEDLVDVLWHLRKQGFTISVDDFGTGYSSLYYLAALPIDVLKIDAAFVAKLLADNKYAEIVKTIIDLGHTLNLEIVAEGVESVAQAKRLIQMGCDQLQGFWLAEPKNYHNINTWLEDIKDLDYKMDNLKTAPCP